MADSNMDDEDDNVESVARFLERRGVHLHVIERFRQHKMDKAAVWASTENDLKELGLVERGHVICLKGFCMPTNNLDKSSLAYSIKQAGKDRLPFKKRSLKEKTVLLGWMHFDQKKHRYTHVRIKKGGGTRSVTFVNEATIEDIVLEARKIFFHSCNRTEFGNEKNMNFCLANYKGDIIEDEEFTLGKYIKTYKLTKTRLYLCSRLKPMGERFAIISSSSSEEDNEPNLKFKKCSNSDEEGHFHNEVEETYIGLPSIQTSTPNASYVEDTEPSNLWSLIGSSSERKALHDEIDRAYEESLAMDQEKEARRAYEESLAMDQEREANQKQIENIRLNELMRSRGSRVAPEPDLVDPHVTISVRHTELGCKVRLFPYGMVFQQVYDWLGGLSPIPEFFAIKDYKGNVISPDTLVFDGTFNMFAMDHPVLMTPQGTIAFQGFAVADQINEKDDQEGELAALQQLRNVEREKLKSKVDLEVSRERIYNDMVQLYKKRNTSTSYLSLSFISEDAIGDGVSRDAYSEFFQALYQKMDGLFEKVPSPTIDDEELEIVGKIITHAYILYDVFPVGMGKTSLKYYLYGAVDDEEILSSFLQFITSNEREFVQQFQANKIDNAQPLIDVFSEYSIFEIPTPSNVRSLLLKAGKAALIRKPCFGFQKLVNGMGDFWKKVSSKMLDSIYDCTVPSADHVIESLHPNEVLSQDQKVTTWLHRYIRSCQKEELIRFVRFITGSETLPPKTVIKLEFVNQYTTHLYPSTKTCFKILILPRQYQSLYQLKKLEFVHRKSRLLECA